jgi:hypothetical protein
MTHVGVLESNKGNKKTSPLFLSYHYTKDRESGVKLYSVTVVEPSPHNTLSVRLIPVKT